MATLVGIAGRATRGGLLLRHGGVSRLVAPDSTPVVVVAGVTPLGMAVREACSAILAGELKPCRWCESITPCDCERWHEYMLTQDPDPHGDLSELSDSDIPY